MKRFFKNAVALLAVLAMLICCCPLSALASDDSGLKFNNGKFKILILSDLQDTDEPQQETVDMITSAITKTEPDLIVLLGDNIAGWWKGVDKAKTDEAIDVIGSTIEKAEFPLRSYSEIMTMKVLQARKTATARNLQKNTYCTDFSFTAAALLLRAKK